MPQQQQHQQQQQQQQGRLLRFALKLTLVGSAVGLVVLAQMSTRDARVTRRPALSSARYEASQEERLRTILIWDGLYGHKDRPMGKGREPFHRLGCQETR